jgi:hypothetical protein
MVLGDHEVDLLEVLRVGQMGSQHRPQIIVLGGMMDLKDLTERDPALRRLRRPTAWPFRSRGERFQAGRVAAQPAMDGPYEAEVGRSVGVTGRRCRRTS